MNKYWISNNQSISEDMRTLLNEYLLSLKLENKAEATITKYGSILEQFFNECTVPLDELTPSDVLTCVNIGVKTPNNNGLKSPSFYG